VPPVAACLHDSFGSEADEHAAVVQHIVRSGLHAGATGAVGGKLHGRCNDLLAQGNQTIGDGALCVLHSVLLQLSSCCLLRTNCLACRYCRLTAQCHSAAQVTRPRVTATYSMQTPSCQ
jgi:hypothetical protein